MHSDKIEYRTVPAICLATFEHWKPRPCAETHFACGLQLHLAGALYGMSVEDAADRENDKGRPEIHHTRIYRLMRRWQADGSIGPSLRHRHRLHQDRRLDPPSSTATARRLQRRKAATTSVSGHKHLKGCKVVAFCDRNCNIIAPFVTAPGNRNESPLLRDALPRLRNGPRHWRGPARFNRQSGWRLRLPATARRSSIAR